MYRACWVFPHQSIVLGSSSVSYVAGEGVLDDWSDANPSSSYNVKSSDSLQVQSSSSAMLSASSTLLHVYASWLVSGHTHDPSFLMQVCRL